MADKQRVMEKITKIREIQTSPLERAYAFLLNIAGYFLIAIMVAAYFVFSWLWEHKYEVIGVVTLVVVIIYFAKKKGWLQRFKRKSKATELIEELPPLTTQSYTSPSPPPFMNNPTEKEQAQRENIYTRNPENWRPQYEG